VTLPVTAQAAFAATVVDEWLRAGVTDVVLAPGSRSTPLALAVDAAPLCVHVHLDERSAGFYALGLALATGRPAPVVVTSGTAAAELHAAVVEAHHACVPLVVCTADRPPELHGVAAPQTIDQRSLFGDVVRWQADVGAVGDLPPSAWRSLAARGIAAALGGPRGPGPVQLNFGFRDPLVAQPGTLIPPGRPGGAPWHRVLGAVDAVADVPAALVSGRRGVIIAGPGAGDPADVWALARALGWPVLAAPASGCRGAPGAVAAFDAIVRHAAMAGHLAPDVVVHLGGAPASKVLAGWTAAAAEHLVADPFGTWPDPDRVASHVVAAPPGAVCRGILAGRPTAAPDGWARDWAAAESAAQAAIDEVLASHAEPTEPGVARTVSGLLGPADALLVASSMPIRDVEWYGAPAMACRVAANRGANGIDGLVSTALGLAAGRSGRTAALLGDLALLHDAGGLLGASRRDVDCCIVVVDNDGGGIFSFLPQSDLPPPQFERLWGTPHGLDLVALATAYGVAAVGVEDGAGVGLAVTEALAAGGVTVVVVRTDRAANVTVHAELVGAVAAALDGVGRRRP